MKQIINFTILIIVFLFSTYSVKAEDVKITLKYDHRKVFKPRIVLIESGKEFYANSKGIVKIKNLKVGKSYSIKVKYLNYQNAEMTKIRVPVIRPTKCSNSNTACYTEYNINL